MGMNKQFKVTFNVTATMSDAQEEEFMETLHGIAKDLDHPVHFDSILIAALTHGTEGAFVQTVKQGLRASIKGMAKECADVYADTFGFKSSPARVEVIR